MTSPARGGPDTAGMLAEVLAAHRTPGVRDGYWQCVCGEQHATLVAHQAHVAAALLPVVQRLAVEKAAEELRAAADDVQRRCVLNKHEAASVLRDRADALAAAARPGDGRTEA